MKRILFGPRTWAGPQYDREYVRPYHFKRTTARRAGETMMTAYREKYPEAQDLPALWEAGGRSVLPEELGNLPKADTADVKISAYGALLQIGHGEPAMIYWNDDEAHDRVLAGYAVIEREGRIRLASPRFLRLGGAVVAIALAVALVIVEFATNVGVWAWIAAGIATAYAVVQIASSVRSLRAEPAPALPHRVKF